MIPIKAVRKNENHNALWALLRPTHEEITQRSASHIARSQCYSVKPPPTPAACQHQSWRHRLPCHPAPITCRIQSDIWVGKPRTCLSWQNLAGPCLSSFYSHQCSAALYYSVFLLSNVCLSSFSSACCPYFIQGTLASGQSHIALDRPWHIISSDDRWIRILPGTVLFYWLAPGRLRGALLSFRTTSRP